jgi:hypothetical protein
MVLVIYFMVEIVDFAGDGIAGSGRFKITILSL